MRGDPNEPGQKTVSPMISQLQSAFSNDPVAVVAHNTQFIEAHRAADVATAIKRYPRHGLTNDDTHMCLVDVTLTARPVERWRFQQMVGRGLADAVMSAHLAHRTVDWPVTLSERFIKP